MPRYDLHCPRCPLTFESSHHINAPHPPCPTCGGPVVQQFNQAPGFSLKGGGWAAQGYSKGKQR